MGMGGGGGGRGKRRGRMGGLNEIYVTPLIDVMLVLLIMFIITIPVQTHAVKLDLPQNSDTTPPPVLPTKNIVVVTAQGQARSHSCCIPSSETTWMSYARRCASRFVPT